MLATVQIVGDRAVIADADRIARNYPEAMVRGMSRIIVGVNSEAVKNLSGPGAKKSKTAAGGYPVPVRIGHLRRSENFVLPGKTKTSNGLSFSAGRFGGIVYNTAEYSQQIHEGRGSSRKYGKRAYISDAVLKYDQGGKMIRVLDEEVSKEL